MMVVKQDTVNNKNKFQTIVIPAKAGTQFLRKQKLASQTINNNVRAPARTNPLRGRSSLTLGLESVSYTHLTLPTSALG